MKTNKFHSGIDVPSQTGEDIRAVAGGKIIYSGWLGGYGKSIMIEHDEGIVSLYAHCNELLFEEGDLVDTGELIAKIGNTGKSTGPHLHFELRFDGEFRDPLEYLVIE